MEILDNNDYLYMSILYSNKYLQRIKKDKINYLKIIIDFFKDLFKNDKREGLELC